MYSTPTNQSTNRRKKCGDNIMMCTDNYIILFGDTPVSPLTAWSCYSLHFLLQYPTYNVSYNILQYPTEILVTLPKKVLIPSPFSRTAPALFVRVSSFLLAEKTENQSNFLSENQSNPILLGFPTRNCSLAGGGLPVAARQQAKKKHIDNRYDYTLHATQDDKHHHDNARTN